MGRSLAGKLRCMFRFSGPTSQARSNSLDKALQLALLSFITFCFVVGYLVDIDGIPPAHGMNPKAKSINSQVNKVAKISSRTEAQADTATLSVGFTQIPQDDFYEKPIDNSYAKSLGDFKKYNSPSSPELDGSSADDPDPLELESAADSTADVNPKEYQLDTSYIGQTKAAVSELERQVGSIASNFSPDLLTLDVLAGSERLNVSDQAQALLIQQVPNQNSDAVIYGEGVSSAQASNMTDSLNADALDAMLLPYDTQIQSTDIPNSNGASVSNSSVANPTSEGIQNGPLSGSVVFAPSLSLNNNSNVNTNTQSVGLFSMSTSNADSVQETSSSVSPEPIVSGLPSVDDEEISNDHLSNIEFAWKDDFDGPGIDLGRFITPESQLIAEGSVLDMSLAAIHSGLDQMIESKRSIKLESTADEISANVKVSDSSANTGMQLKTAESVLMISIPLKHSDSSQSMQPTIFASMVVVTNPDNVTYQVSLGVHELVEQSGHTSELISLGDTVFDISAKQENTSSDPFTDLSFSLNVGSAEQVVLGVNGNVLTVPTAAALPAENSIMNIDLSASGLIGDYSSIDVELGGLFMNDLFEPSLANRLVLDDSESATIGYSLNVYDGAARLSAGNVEAPATVELVARTKYSVEDWVREIESINFATELSIHYLGLANIAENRGTLNANASSVSIVLPLFDVSIHPKEEHIFAVIKGVVTRDPANGEPNLDVVAQLVSMDGLLAGAIDPELILSAGTVLSEAYIGERLSFDADVTIEIDSVGDRIMYTWGDKSVQLFHQYDAVWFPTLDGDAVIVVESAPASSLVIDVNNMSVSRR